MTKAQHIERSRIRMQVRQVLNPARWKQQLDGSMMDERRVPYGACICFVTPCLHCPVDDHRIAWFEDNAEFAA